MPKLIVGEVYADLARSDKLKLTYVGPGPEHEVFSADGSNHAIVQVLRKRVAKDVIPYTEPLIALDTGTRWARTRHDHTGQIAEIIIPTYTWKGETYVTYAVIVNGDAKPRTKTENDFRRVFGHNLNHNV